MVHPPKVEAYRSHLDGLPLELIDIHAPVGGFVKVVWHKSPAIHSEGGGVQWVLRDGHQDAVVLVSNQEFHGSMHSLPNVQMHLSVVLKISSASENQTCKMRGSRV